EKASTKAATMAPSNCSPGKTSARMMLPTSNPSSPDAPAIMNPNTTTAKKAHQDKLTADGPAAGKAISRSRLAPRGAGSAETIDDEASAVIPSRSVTERWRGAAPSASSSQ